MADEEKQFTDSEILEMSDEDFLKLGESSFQMPAEESSDDGTVTIEEALTQDVQEEEEDSELEDETETPTEDDTEEEEDSDDNPETEEDTSEEEENTSDAFKEDTGTKPKAPTKKEPAKSEPVADADSIDYKSIYEQIFAPFKAVGRDIQVQSTDEVINLMKQGADYTKKMTAMKPGLKLLKTLENAKIDENKLNYLIDLNNKDPQAINKLIHDSGVDTDELDAEDVPKYRPKSHAVSDKRIELDQVLDSIKHSPNYNRTLDVVADSWDKKSQDVITDSPQIIGFIEEQISSGVYDVINVEMQRLQNIGQLGGLSDLEAYHQVGESIKAKGGFDHLQSAQTQGQQNQTAKRQVQPKKKAIDQDLKDRRKAATASKGNPSSKKPSLNDLNPLEMSDDDFMKNISHQLR
jgi:hypothetical protein